ncbi:uncharacterized protein BX663DRAFT_499828 [Cokeromyces recurvatus]|uniref:uncharacterized protein n=1 Tax=Cokeromyces recurvatus TaxID=90255 RepID=UPI0022210168|nr:uncharacterized protein BX663DRAFT_499828 [Cokeromyces recurvatus]KAI7905472.1 hypothetical protein BX663DRAFT_499828 [Cokeromyces recurvatus]
MSLLQPYMNLDVLVITLDGRVLVGKLRGTDQTSNLILEHCQERVFSSEGTEVVPLGLFVVRGDNLCTIGEIDTEKEETMDITEIKADPLSEARL